MYFPNHNMMDISLMDTIYQALNSIMKPIMDNIAGGSFVDLTFLETLEMLDQMTKQSRVWYTRDFVVASPIVSGSIIVDQYKKEEEYDQGMAHLKTQMDLLTKYLLFGKIKKVKAVVSQGRSNSDSEEEENYLNNQEVLEAISKEVKVITITTRLVTRIEIEGTRRAKMIGVDYMYLMKVEIILQLALARCSWRK